MATEPSANSSAAEADPAQTPPARRGALLPRLLVAALVAAVITAECAVAYLCLPSPGEAAAMAGAVNKPSPGKARQEAEAEEQPADVEVDLGEFSVTALQSAANLTLRIDFHLFGSVSPDNEKEFKRLLEDNKHRFREQVLVTVRSADIHDLTDASLGLVKRTILERTHRTLGKPLLREVIISDYSFVEQ